MCCTRLLGAYASQVLSTYDITRKKFTYIPVTDNTHLKESKLISQNLHHLTKIVSHVSNMPLQKLLYINKNNKFARNGMEKYSSLFHNTVHIMTSKHKGLQLMREYTIIFWVEI